MRGRDENPDQGCQENHPGALMAADDRHGAQDDRGCSAGQDHQTPSGEQPVVGEAFGRLHQVDGEGNTEKDNACQGKS